jgi:hypothetical protein
MNGILIINLFLRMRDINSNGGKFQIGEFYDFFSEIFKINKFFWGGLGEHRPETRIFY